VPDGALLPHGDEPSPGATERAARALGQRLDLSDAAIHDALDQGKREQFSQTELYRRVFALAERREGRTLPRALVPQIQLRGPKISRSLTTSWYAHRVEQRFRACLKSADA
jgi:hypothetical protein